MLWRSVCLPDCFGAGAIFAEGVLRKNFYITNNFAVKETSADLREQSERFATRIRHRVRETIVVVL